MSNSVRPHRRQPTRLLHPWDSPGKNTGVGCHFLLQCMKVKVKSLSCVRLFATPWTAAYQAPLFMGFSSQEYWSGVPLPSLKKRLDPIFQRKFYANRQYMKEIKGLHSTVTNPFPFLSARRPRALRGMWGISREQTEIHHPSHVYQGTVARKG